MKLRPYQSESIERLRQHLRAGHKRVVLAAATGAGKSVMMLDVIRTATEKGSRVLFICERRILVEQFSKHLDSIGIDHGVLMAKHWRFSPEHLVQVASAQTLERMETWPAFDVVFIDELHACMRASVITMLENFPRTPVIGATATPFHPDIGKHFTAVSNVIAMAALVEQKNLVPFRVFVAKEIDTTGLKVVAGEWKKDELEQRGQKIVGDIVADYVRITQLVWGEPRKTICFSCGVAHGADLVERFQAIGINAVQITYRDSDEFKAEVLADFARPDTTIQVLISADILTRGYDQTDVEHVILARPLKKSFSSHVQMVGRGARPHDGKEFCIASGQRVLTHRGLVAIEAVRPEDRLWDGYEWVTHGGVIYKGVKHVIEYAGLVATPDHLVKTRSGWRPFGDCAAKQIGIAKTGSGGNCLREGADYFSGNAVAGESLGSFDVCVRRVRELWRKKVDFVPKLAARHCEGMPSMQPAEGRSAQGSPRTHRSPTSTLYEPIRYAIQGLRSTWNRVPVSNCSGRISLGIGELRFAEGVAGDAVGSSEQRRPLRARESLLGHANVQPIAHKATTVARAIAFVSRIVSRRSLRGCNVEEAVSLGPVGQRDRGSVLQSSELQTERPVWDILNVGPRNCFTVEGLLVHNCVIQDNSGNWLRFQDDWEQLFHHGVQTLSDEVDRKQRKEPTQQEKERAKCPKCGSLWPSRSDVCPACGHVWVRANATMAVAGEMEELSVAKKEKYPMEVKRRWYAELLGFAYRKGYDKWQGWAYWAYKEKFGVGPSGAKPAPAAEMSPEVWGWIVHRNIRSAKQRQKPTAQATAQAGVLL